MESIELRAKVQDVRERMLHLHKILLDAERARYVQAHGPVATSAQMLQLVLSHPSFEWLRAISKLIVQFDEWIAEKDEASTEEGEALLAVARRLFQSDDSQEEFAKKYAESVASDSTARSHHRDLIRALGGLGH